MSVSPGSSIGPFCLGMPISAALSVMQTSPEFSACPHKVSYNQTEPLAHHLLLDVPSKGLQLRFDFKTQRLMVIQVTDPTRVALSYMGCALSPSPASGGAPTFLEVYELFGPTYPGDMERKLGMYLLNYRGITFTFRIPSKYHSMFVSTNDVPLELPDGTTPVVHSISVYQGDIASPTLPSSGVSHSAEVAAGTTPAPVEPASSAATATPTTAASTSPIPPPPAAPAVTPAATAASVSAPTPSMAPGSPVSVALLPCQCPACGHFGGCGGKCDTGHQIRLAVSGGMAPTTSVSPASSSSSSSPSSSSISFGSSLQDVLSVLGPPSRVFAKPKAKMQIHRHSDVEGSWEGCCGRLAPGKGGDGGSASASTSASGTVPARHPVRLPSQLAPEGGVPPSPADPARDYFFNYFGLGIDVMLDGRTHRVKTVVLHTNFPGHPKFNQYNKCEFVLGFHAPPTGDGTDNPVGKHEAEEEGKDDGSDSVGRSSLDSTPASPSDGLADGEEDVDTDGYDTADDASPSTVARPASTPGGLCLRVDADMRWRDIEAALGPAGRPMVHTHGLRANPFGPTYFYAYNGIIFEVLREGYLASVTLFEVPM